MAEDSLKMIHIAAQAIFDKKGINILGLDVRKISTITDYILIAEGAVNRHVIAIAQHLLDILKEQGEKQPRVEGLQEGDWVVIDCLNYMIHLFMPGLRDKYRLEELFRDGKLIDLKIELDKNLVSN